MTTQPCYLTTETHLTPDDFEKLTFEIDFKKQVTLPLPLVNRYISTPPECPENMYFTNDYSACNLFDVRQIFNYSLTSCITNKTLPILSLKLEDLCFLHDRSKPATVPYNDNACDILATGVAEYLQIPYHPLEDRPLSLHTLWVTNNTVTWIPITRENLINNEFLCMKNYQTDILEHKENQLINALNGYYALLNKLQNIFHTNYFDMIINSAKDKCSTTSENIMDFATVYIYCLKDELTKYASTLDTSRKKRSILDLFSDRASNSQINSALGVTYKDMENLHKFSTHLLANEKTILGYVDKLKNDFTYFSTQQRILTLYNEMISTRLLQDKVYQVQLDILQLQNIYTELEKLVENIISIGDDSRRLIVNGIIYHINEHHYRCTDKELKCVWEVDTRILITVSVKRIKCKAVYNGSLPLIPTEHDSIVDTQNMNASMGYIPQNRNTVMREFLDPVYKDKGQLYMSEKGIQQFICLNTTEVIIDGTLRECRPNETLTVLHSVTLDNIKYLVESHFMADQNLQRIVRNMSLLPFLDHITEDGYNVTSEEVPTIHYVQIQTYIEYSVMGFIILVICLLICCWCHPTADCTNFCRQILTCCKHNQQNNPSMETSQVGIQMEPLITTDPSTSTVRFRRSNDNRDSPAIDLNLDPNLATAMNWSSYFTLNKNEQTNMLKRVFHDDVQSINARKLLYRIRRPQALKDIIKGPPGQDRELRIRQNARAIETLETLIRTVENGTTTTSRGLEIIADISEAIVVLRENRTEL